MLRSLNEAEKIFLTLDKEALHFLYVHSFTIKMDQKPLEGFSEPKERDADPCGTSNPEMGYAYEYKIWQCRWAKLPILTWDDWFSSSPRSNNRGNVGFGRHTGTRWLHLKNMSVPRGTQSSNIWYVSFWKDGRLKNDFQKLSPLLQ